MIICMYEYHNLIAVTDRKLCAGDFYEQLRKVAVLGPPGLILREKDLPDAAYEMMAVRAQEICAEKGVPFFVHGRPELAGRIGCGNIHLPLHVLEGLGGRPADTGILRVSCHSREDVEKAAALGADRIILGTVFETGCKPGLPGKGTAFVREICALTDLPVYAIGGITPGNVREVMEAGAAGGCMMSGYMNMP